MREWPELLEVCQTFEISPFCLCNKKLSNYRKAIKFTSRICSDDNRKPTAIESPHGRRTAESQQLAASA
jgi:hypothetical protein